MKDFENGKQMKAQSRPSHQTQVISATAGNCIPVDAEVHLTARMATHLGGNEETSKDKRRLKQERKFTEIK